jgi:hypothetical protein
MPRKPWEPVKGESASAYAAFVLYRDQGIGRTVMDLERTIEEMGDPNVSRKTLQNWKEAHNWESRIKEYDADIARVRKSEEDKQTRRTAAYIAQQKRKRLDENLVLASLLKAKAAEMLKHPTQRVVSESMSEVKDKDGRVIAQIIQQTIEPNRWSQRDMALMIRCAYDMEKGCLLEDEDNRIEISAATLSESDKKLLEFRRKGIEAITNIPTGPPGGFEEPTEDED